MGPHTNLTESKEPIQLLEQRSGLPELLLQHGEGRVRLSLQGAHITAYAPDGRNNLLWLSESAQFSPGTAIRGGIPLCWPWFGANPDVPERPQHGYARTRRFQLKERQCNAQFSGVTLELDDESEFPEWHEAARLEVEIRLSDRLWIEMRTHNQTDGDLLVGGALHNYFRVSDCHNVAIPAVENLSYRDKPDGFTHKRQSSPLRIKDEVDRVYLQPPAEVELIDPIRPGTLRLNAWGNTDLVVWNPGPDIAKKMKDFDNDGYLRMVCVEPALALDNRRCLAPGERFSMGQTIQQLSS